MHTAAHNLWQSGSTESSRLDTLVEEALLQKEDKQDPEDLARAEAQQSLDDKSGLNLL